MDQYIINTFHSYTRGSGWTLSALAFGMKLFILDPLLTKERVIEDRDTGKGVAYSRFKTTNFGLFNKLTYTGSSIRLSPPQYWIETEYSIFPKKVVHVRIEDDKK